MRLNIDNDMPQVLSGAHCHVRDSVNNYTIQIQVQVITKPAPLDFTSLVYVYMHVHAGPLRWARIVSVC